MYDDFKIVPFEKIHFTVPNILESGSKVYDISEKWNSPIISQVV